MKKYTPEQERFILDISLRFVAARSANRHYGMTSPEDVAEDGIRHGLALLKAAQEEGLLKNDYTKQSPCCSASMTSDSSVQCAYTGLSVKCDECDKKYSPEELGKL